MSIVTVQPRVRPSPMVGNLCSGTGGYLPSIPKGSNWNAADEIQSCPPGLEYLIELDQLLVKQNVEMMEALTGFESNNKYIISSKSGNRVYFAVEETDWCTRACCGPGRPFDIKILDYQGTEVIHLNRPMACPCYCLPWWPQKLEVSAPPGTVIGRVVQAGTFCEPANFEVQDYDGKKQFTIKGPCCHCSFFQDTEYQVLCRNGINEHGTIRKQWAGFFKEALTDADNFGITFPEDIDITMKATLIGALFLIDFMFFERVNNHL